MSDKPASKLNELDLLIRRTIKAGMDEGTLLTIEFVAGFEKFNTRPYHNYETWGQGYRISGKGITLEREDLDDALKDWAAKVEAGPPTQPPQSSEGS